MPKQLLADYPVAANNYDEMLDSANQPSDASMSVDNSVQFAPPATHLSVVAPPAANAGSAFSVDVTALDAASIGGDIGPLARLVAAGVRT